MSTSQSRPAGAECLRPKRDAWTICSPHEYFGAAFQDKISNNRAHKAQRWIFDLISGKVDESETVYIDRAQWMLVLSNKPAAAPSDTRYLVVFKDRCLHSIRNLHARHIALLDEVEAAVCAFLRKKHANHRQFQCYFHYMPSVFQLHMHVCLPRTSDAGRVHPLGLVRRNLGVQNNWYRDALILCPAQRQQRSHAAHV